MRKNGRPLAHATVPCPTCPWRRSSTVGGFDIPRFDIELMRGLRTTVGGEDAFRPIMACHYSGCGAESACVGYIARVGWSNLAVRVAALQGRVNMDGIVADCASLDLWSTFEDMLAAYEAAADPRRRAGAYERRRRRG